MNRQDQIFTRGIRHWVSECYAGHQDSSRSTEHPQSRQDSGDGAHMEKRRINPAVGHMASFQMGPLCMLRDLNLNPGGRFKSHTPAQIAIFEKSTATSPLCGWFTPLPYGISL